MQRTLLIILVFTILVAVFALQNSEEVVIRLWFWSIETSLALVVLLAFAAGALMGILSSIPGRKRRKKKVEAAPSQEPAEGEMPEEDLHEEGDPEFEDIAG